MRLAYCAAVFSLSLLLIQPAFSEPGKSLQLKSATIDTFLPSDEKRTQFGRLEFLGGLHVTSKDDSFGGISGIRMLDESRFIAVTDQGKWLTGEIARENEKPDRIENARMGRLREKSGKKLSGKRRADSEGIEIFGDEFLISFERIHRVERFSFKDNALRARSKKPFIELDGLDLKNNKGPEGVALAPEESPLSGSVLAFPENAVDKNGNYRVFVLTDGKREEFAIIPSDEFSFTDAAFMPNGNLVLLERRFSFLTGPGMRIRMFEGSRIKAGAVLEGQVLMSASGSYEIDNMEALGLSQMSDGAVRLTLVSDDNFAKYQRTILLEFRLVE